MIKIAIIEPSGNLYGSEMVLLDILKHIDRKKFDFQVFLPRKSPLINLLKNEAIKYSETLPASNDFSLFKIFSYLKVSYLIQRKGFDLFFINQAGILRPIAFFNNILSNKPIVCEVSTLEDAYWVNKLDKSYRKNVINFIANSNYIAAQLHVPDNLKSMLYYGYQFKQLPEVSKQTDKKVFKIALLGRISESKGHFLLIEAAKLLKSLPFEYYIIGSAPSKDIEDDFKNKIRDAELEHQFMLRGFRTNIADELEDMHLMVIPSLKEPFGRIFCEAAEAKLPTVVSDSGGLGELSHYFKVGLRFKAESAEDLAEKLKISFAAYESFYEENLKSSTQMLGELNINIYAKIIEDILEAAVLRKENAVNWQGINSL